LRKAAGADIEHFICLGDTGQNYPRQIPWPRVEALRAREICVLAARGIRTLIAACQQTVGENVKLIYSGVVVWDLTVNV
jgi:hypothetical protein